MVNQSPSSMLFAGNMYKFGSKGFYWEYDTYDGSEKSWNDWRNKWKQEDGGAFTTAQPQDIWMNPGNRDYRLRAGSPAIDAGTALTRTRSSGQGRTVPLHKSWYFHDGYTGLIQADSVRIGTRPATLIESVDYIANTITLKSSTSWSEGEPVNLNYMGSAPDIGAVEYADQTGTALLPPSNFRFGS
jgi:hypothetical protein